MSDAGEKTNPTMIGGLPARLLLQAINSTRSSVTIADARAQSFPLIFVNDAFVALSGFSREEALGRNCNFLQGDDTNPEAIQVLRTALSAGKTCTVTLRNYRRDGTAFWNELMLSPVKDATGTVTHYMGVQHDVTDRIEAEQALLASQEELEQANHRLEALANHDPLTGLHNRRFFHKEAQRQLCAAKRLGLEIATFMIDIDKFKQYNDHYGHQLGDQALCKVAEVLESLFQRATDLLARFGGEEFIAFTTGQSAEEAEERAQAVCNAVRGLGIVHKASKIGDCLTVSVGCVHGRAATGLNIEVLMRQADTNLYRAKNEGRDRSIVGLLQGTRALTGELPLAHIESD